ncbi:MAG: HlyD family efflux transporter periplasmic adaptor subunit [Rhizobiaceae bacterium]
MMSWICLVPVIAGLFSACNDQAYLATGYVEGEYVLLAPLETAQVITIDVRKGDRVGTGSQVAILESRDAELAVQEAEAAMLNARAVLENLKSGKRAEEISVIEASLRLANVQLEEARRALQRQKELSSGGFSSTANLDAAATALELAEGRVGELEATLAVARLPARPAEIDAAHNRLDQTDAALSSARWRLSQRTVIAPQDGEIADVISRVGELSGPQSPVVSLLPDGAVKLKLFVPQSALADVTPGRRLNVHCDNCPQGLTATVSYVSKEPEFTPPVIYSSDNRQKLVYLVEARPDARTDGTGSGILRPGLIVDVQLAPAQGAAQ